jgi:hypothetical protein
MCAKQGKGAQLSFAGSIKALESMHAGRCLHFSRFIIVAAFAVNKTTALRL